jgi:hypothetical protein
MSEPEEQDREFMDEDKKYPYCDSLNKELTPFDIVDLLRSGDGKDRTKALNELYPGMTASLVTVNQAGEIGMATAEGSDVFKLWTALCWAAAYLGNQLGMSLQWGPKPVDDKKIVVVTGGVPPPKGG